ncbi:uncharacterized protein LOC130010689 [Patella vulgata]|uniref:uncharacterized protein LOC126816094 n=1 Tax=Patella vulgata TaxID=6465 RepID=UPI0021803EB3|nr:uncharacterized protein LOC126816094 [Patella vulgata]XP_050404335.1 uncharacterized protein LOC126820424 [Patella vulgata]XP_055954519.1 uncharacterized protein LOC130010689 [Patella vulgata]
MPRRYTPKPESRKLCQYSAESLQTAIVACERGILSQRKACEQFGIPRGTLQNRLAGRFNKQHGGQTVFDSEEELIFAEYLTLLSTWGFPLDAFDFRCIVKSYLDKCKRTEKRFKNNLPSSDWVNCFVKRHKGRLTSRFCQNIKVKRAEVSAESLNQYFDNLEASLADVPSSNILNYDETNLTDDPGKKKCIFRRGSKYPERIMNSTKSSTSLMFTATASGRLLPLYVVYRSKHLMNTWTESGPKNARYNRSKSGWFDNVCFTDWFKSVVLPWAQDLPGKKVVLGDNLSSHFSVEVLKLCKEHNIEFICFPANSTHLCQPLDVSVFSSVKVAWRSILTEWKEGPGRKAACITKDVFPRLLKKLVDRNTTMSSNIISGFKKTGIFPLNREEVIDRLPNTTNNTVRVDIFSDVFLNSLDNLRYSQETPTIRRKRVSVEPGKSISADDLETGGPSSSKCKKTKDVLEEPASSNLESSDDESSCSSLSSNDSVAPDDNFEVAVGKWVIVRYLVKSRCIHYIGRIIDTTLSDDDESRENEILFYVISFLRKSKRVANTFVPPIKEDIDTIKWADILKVLPFPTISKRNHHKFQVNFDGYNLQ